MLPSSTMMMMHPAEEAVMNHHKRLRLRDWLEMRIGNPRYPGLEWVDERRKIFRIPWKHGARHGWKENEDARIFREWSEHTGACPRDTKQHKANFRCALNSLKDVKKIPFLSKRKGDDAYRVYQLQSGNKNNKNPNRWIRKRVSRHNRMTSSTNTTTTAAAAAKKRLHQPVTQSPPPYSVTSSIQHYVIGDSSCDSWNDAMTSQSATEVGNAAGSDLIHFREEDDATTAFQHPNFASYSYPMPCASPCDVTAPYATQGDGGDLSTTAGHYMMTASGPYHPSGHGNYYHCPQSVPYPEEVGGYHGHGDYYQPVDDDVTISAAIETASATVYSYDFPGAAVAKQAAMTSSPATYASATAAHWMLEETDDKNLHYYDHYHHHGDMEEEYYQPPPSQEAAAADFRLPPADTLLCLNSGAQW